MRVCVCVCVCVPAHAHVCACVCVVCTCIHCASLYVYNDRHNIGNAVLWNVVIGREGSRLSFNTNGTLVRIDIKM